MRLALERHPVSPAAVATAIAVDARRDGDRLVLRYALTAAAGRVRIPAPGPPRFEIGLWRHTCFEAFVAIDGAREYHEWNLSPSRAWAAHAFCDVREGRPLDDARLAPYFTARSGVGEVVLEARIDLAAVSAAHAGACLRVGLAAVVEGSDGGLEYWALRHASALPDFHQPASFALLLEPSGEAVVIPQS